VKIKLNHIHTPESLKPINDEISMILEEDDVNIGRLGALCVTRDKEIRKTLTALSSCSRKQFAEKEYEKNLELTNFVQNLLNSTKEQVLSISRSKEAIKKYR
jgi:hypothetical protein